MRLRVLVLRAKYGHGTHGAKYESYVSSEGFSDASISFVVWV